MPSAARISVSGRPASVLAIVGSDATRRSSSAAVEPSTNVIDDCVTSPWVRRASSAGRSSGGANSYCPALIARSTPLARASSVRSAGCEITPSAASLRATEPSVAPGLTSSV